MTSIIKTRKSLEFVCFVQQINPVQRIYRHSLKHQTLYANPTDIVLIYT